MNEQLDQDDDNNENNKGVNQDEMWGKIAHEVEVVCGKIFETVNIILSAHSNFGFTEINKNIDPSIEDIVRIMQVTEFVLDKFSSSIEDFSQKRQINNAAQMIWCVKGLVMAIRDSNIADYEAMIEKMRNQAQH